MAHNPEAFAEMVVLTVKAALAPVLERLSASEQRNADLLTRIEELSGLRDRVTAVETKAAMTAASVEKTGPSAAEVELVVLNRLDPLTKHLDGLSARVAAVETKPEPVAVTPALLTSVPSAAEIELSLRDRTEPLTKQIAGLSERIAVLEVRAPVPGPAGTDGRDGKDGLHGKDGVDGLGFDDLDVEFDGDRTVLLKFVKGDRQKSWPIVLPFMRQQGVFTEGRSYVPGDVVTWGGSQWHCEAETTAKPGEGSKSWTLVVKRGRDGKDGKDAIGAPPVVTIARPS